MTETLSNVLHDELDQLILSNQNALPHGHIVDLSVTSMYSDEITGLITEVCSISKAEYRGDGIWVLVSSRQTVKLYNPDK